jgi:lipopolysaccharide/colanic/teichoic acid biosynthesis glycosyltransferase
MESVHSATNYAWVKALDPDRRVLRGRSYYIVKRILDLGLVILSLPVWLPLMGLIALAIRICSPGAPVIFVQLRTGRGGKRFPMFKFRTMVPNAEELKRTYAHLNELAWPDFKIENDPRTIPLGHFLRRNSLDELPQLFNVLRGEMSLVGPRPTSFGPETYKLWHTARLDVMPGMTGLWQIYSRGSTDFDERLRIDIAYIERRSLWLDIQILARTILAAFQRRGIY